MLFCYKVQFYWLRKLFIVLVIISHSNNIHFALLLMTFYRTSPETPVNKNAILTFKRNKKLSLNTNRIANRFIKPLQNNEMPKKVHRLLEACN